MTLSPAEKRQFEKDEKRLSELGKRFPLAFARLWDPLCLLCSGPMEHLERWLFRCGECDVTEPRTSQRLAIELLMDPSVSRGFITGGNRTGKSEAAAQVGVAFALGRGSNQVQIWAARNRIDVSHIQPGPGKVWAIALDSGDSRRYVRPKVAKYLPSGSRWRNREGPGEAEVHLPNGGIVQFKNVDQGRDGFQGDAIHFAYFDEEPSPAVVSEVDFRLIDFDHRGGNEHLGLTKMLFPMTPLMGWTPLLRHNLRGDPTGRKVYLSLPWSFPVSPPRSSR